MDHVNEESVISFGMELKWLIIFRAYVSVLKYYCLEIEEAAFNQIPGSQCLYLLSDRQ